MKLKSFVHMDGKNKVNLLNYFMSELLENVLNDIPFYFIDSMINKQGIHRTSEATPLRKLDNEIFEILQINDKEKLKIVKKMQCDVL
jgi:hypothetical protein